MNQKMRSLMRKTPVDGMIKEKNYQEHPHIPPHLDDDQKETANDDFN